MVFDPYGYDLATSAGPQGQPGAALPAEALQPMPQAAQHILWRGLTAAVEDTLNLWENTPPGVKRQPPLFAVQHAGKSRFNPAALRAETLRNWHRVTGLELRLAAQALEALIQEDQPIHRERLAEQYIRVSQLYGELAWRAGHDVACCILRWELRLLRYRASPIVGPLIYD
jgi:hypothetical protein